MPAAKPRQRARNPDSGQRTPLTYYRSAEKPSTSSPFEKKIRPRGRKWLPKVVDFLVVALVLSGVVYSLIIRPDPKLVVNSTAYHQASAYRVSALADFKSLKNRNKLTFDEKGIIADLQKRFPEIASAAVELPLFGETPRLRINIASPTFILNSQGSDYIVDSQGVAVTKKADAPQIAGLLVVIDQTGFNTQIGRQIISAAEVNFINTLLAQTKRAKVPIASLTLPPLAQELDLRTSDQGYFAKFYLGGDALVQSGQFLAARHQFEQANSQPSQYLDVRVPGKIYYK